MSGIKMNKRGDRVWDETVESVDLPGVGILERWSSGVKGGGSECHHAKLTSKRKLDAEVLREVADKNDIKSGNAFDGDSKPPREDEPENGGSWVYKWTYMPSTN